MSKHESEEAERQALEFAIIKHNGQIRRNSGEPYVNHPIRVASTVRELCGVEESRECGMYIAALLHDTLEDTDASKEEIIEQFGREVYWLVHSLTNDKEMLAGVGKTAYLRNKIANLSTASLLIKACDRLDNITDIKPADSGDEWSVAYAQQTYSIFYDQVKENPKRRYKPLDIAFERIKATLVSKGYPCPWHPITNILSDQDVHKLLSV